MANAQQSAAQDLSLDRLSAHYGMTRVLEEVSLTVKAGQLVSLLGASGCGKTTALRVVAGFVAPSGGHVRLGSRDLTRLPPHRRDIGLVFQNYALFPHLTVAENIAFGLKQRGVSSTERQTRVAAMLDRVGLGALAARLPPALSGGQKQRVALARALVINPALLMFDEPLSNLDAKLRVDMRVEIHELQRSNGTTTLYVTHDQEEAFSISDHVAVMRAGLIEQFDTPETLYRRPANAFVARFVGFENFLPMRVLNRAAEGVVAEAPGGALLPLAGDSFGAIPDRFVLATRPDGLVVAHPDHQNGMAATASLRTYLGRAYQYRCESAAGSLLANGPLAPAAEAGQAVRLVLNPEQCCLLPETALD